MHDNNTVTPATMADSNLSSDPTRINTYVAAALAPRTRHEYQADLRRFLTWGGTLPSSPEQLAHYLATHAPTHGIATLLRWRVSIGRAHTAQGISDPSHSALVKAVLRGIRREHGSQQRQVTPMLRDDVIAMVRDLGSQPKEVRDRALLLVGFAGALRRSELVALKRSDVLFSSEGLKITLRRSKTDQEQYGRDIGIPYARGSVCAVRALKAWLALIESPELNVDPPYPHQPVFRAVNRHGQIAPQALSDRAVVNVIKARCLALGLDPQAYSGHSLRAGFCTSAALAGKPNWQIRKQTGHKTDVMLNRYIRDGRLFADNPLEGIL